MNPYSFFKKNKYLLLVLLFVLPVQVPAQGFVGKIYLGANSSQIDGDKSVGYNKSGVLCGLAVEYYFSERLSVQPSVFYSRKGARAGRNDPVFFVNRVNFIDIPVFLNIYLVDQVFLNLGLTAAYFVNASYEDEFGGISERLEAHYPFDYLYNVGASYYVADKLELSIKFSRSLMNAAPQGIWHNNLSFTAAYILGERPFSTR